MSYDSEHNEHTLRMATPYGDVLAYPYAEELTRSSNSQGYIIVVEGTGDFRYGDKTFTHIKVTVDSDKKVAEKRFIDIHSTVYDISTNIGDHRFVYATWDEGNAIASILADVATEYSYTDEFTNFRNTSYAEAIREGILEAQEEIEDLEKLIEKMKNLLP